MTILTHTDLFFSALIPFIYSTLFGRKPYAILYKCLCFPCKVTSSTKLLLLLYYPRNSCSARNRNDFKIHPLLINIIFFNTDISGKSTKILKQVSKFSKTYNTNSVHRSVPTQMNNSCILPKGYCRQRTRWRAKCDLLLRHTGVHMEGTQVLFE